MTLSEFKAWFEGFTESIEGKSAPTQKQWARIKEKVALIDGAPITQHIYVDRWVQPYRHYWDRYWTTAGMASGDNVAFLNAVGRNDGIGVASAEGTVFTGYSDGVQRGPLIGELTATFDSHAAMRELGRVEAHAA